MPVWTENNGLLRKLTAELPEEINEKLTEINGGPPQSEGQKSFHHLTTKQLIIWKNGFFQSLSKAQGLASDDCTGQPIFSAERSALLIQPHKWTPLRLPEVRAGPKGVSTKGVSTNRSNFPYFRAFYTAISKRNFLGQDQKGYPQKGYPRIGQISPI